MFTELSNLFLLFLLKGWTSTHVQIRGMTTVKHIVEKRNTEILFLEFKLQNNLSLAHSQPIT